MRIPSYLLASMCLLVACTENTAPVPETAQTKTTAEGIRSTTHVRKFRSITTSGDGTVSDTMLIDLIFHGDSLSGRMHWLPGMKDKMKGTLAGHLRGDTVVANYSYSAEGTQRTEPRFFLLGPGRITILSGDAVENGTSLEALTIPKLEPGMVVPEVR